MPGPVLMNDEVEFLAAKAEQVIGVQSLRGKPDE
jgi:hypothetical protein